ncbi:hypothetical protein NDU88_000510 [Pleurodeles waltl]|uniref:Uncharacterized protein n=1 Tax=Pleurodeles waltl TaxID=8319 RepID=A0AAV7UQ70_PLEWA|nr:hypothetical protein NDU88_000510 [Pleurodeles waltl]
MGRTKGKQMEGGDLPTPEDHGLLRPAKDSVDKLDFILQEIKDSRQAIENRLSSITIELNILKDDQAKLSERIKHTESDITEILPTHNTCGGCPCVLSPRIPERKEITGAGVVDVRASCPRGYRKEKK